MRSRINLGLVWCYLPLLVQCGGALDRQELVSKLRPIGVMYTGEGSPTVELTEVPQVRLYEYLVLLPKTKTLTATFQNETPGPGVFTLTSELVQIDAQNIIYEDFATLRLAKIPLVLTLPTQAGFGKLVPKGQGKIRYGLRFLASESTTPVLALASLIVYPQAAPELTWDMPSIEITSPQLNMEESLEEISLVAAVTNPNGERIKIGWFTALGEIKNRRADQTIWKVTARGQQTLLVTVRGLSTMGFAYHLIDVVLP